MLRIVGRLLVMALMCAFITLGAFVRTSQASSTLSSTTATAVSAFVSSTSNTINQACANAPKPSKRLLASGKLSRTQNLCRLGQLSLNKVHWFYQRDHRWVLLLRHAKCVQAPNARWAGLCYKARQTVRRHMQRLQWVGDKLSPLLVAAWLSSHFDCIHHYEGSWTANTGNGYYGGLQMDWGFQSMYGLDFIQRWGTANNWPVWAQKLAASRAYLSGRGFGPWPNTAKACGYSTAPVASQSTVSLANA